MAAPMNLVPPSTITRIGALLPLSAPEAGQLAGVALPVLGHLDPEIEVDLGAEQGLELGPGLGADVAQDRPAAAEHDRLLAGPLPEKESPEDQQGAPGGGRPAPAPRGRGGG